MKIIFLIISTVLPLIGPFIYSKAILKGNARPHRTTTLVLLIINVLTATSLIAQGNNVAVWLAIVSVIQSVMVFTLSIKYGMGGWAKTDIACLIIAFIGIVAWQITKQPILALYFSLLADFTGVIPTLIKTYSFPKTEIWSYYLLDTVAGVFNLLALSAWTIEDYSYPLYVVFINLAVVILVLKPKLVKQKA